MATAKKTNLKPLDDRVVVKPNEPEEKTASGIILPEGAQEKPLTGEIIAAGPGKIGENGKRTPLSVKKGDVVIYGKFGGNEVDIDGKEHKILRESELLGVYEK